MNRITRIYLAGHRDPRGVRIRRRTGAEPQYGTGFMRAMPPNLYGPGDNFDLETSHVLPALLRRIPEAKSNGRRTVTLWGDGTARKLMDVSKLAALGWRATTGLREGIEKLVQKLRTMIPELLEENGRPIETNALRVVSEYHDVLIGA